MREAPELVARVENLTCVFDGVQALDDVTIGFPKKLVTAVVGPNGAGKTTLLNAITGFGAPQSGRCFALSADITGWKPDRIARHGIVRTFQGVRLAMGLSTLDNLLVAMPYACGDTLFASVFRSDAGAAEQRHAEQARGILSSLGLPLIEQQPAHELSYGQKKLIAIACAEASGAPVLLLDEPVSGIDPPMRMSILRRLEMLRSAGRTVVFVEHDIEAVREVADWVVVFEAGRVTTQGRTAQVLKQEKVLEVLIG